MGEEEEGVEVTTEKSGEGKCGQLRNEGNKGGQEGRREGHDKLLRTTCAKRKATKRGHGTNEGMEERLTLPSGNGAGVRAVLRDRETHTHAAPHRNRKSPLQHRGHIPPYPSPPLPPLPHLHEE